jgi:hypothetical protein
MMIEETGFEFIQNVFSHYPFDLQNCFVSTDSAGDS